MLGLPIGDWLKSMASVLLVPSTHLGKEVAGHALDTDYIARLAAILNAWVVPYVPWAWPLLIALLLVLASGFVAKRKLFRSEDLYAVETRAFQCLAEQRRPEVPLDILALMVLLIAYSLIEFATVFNRPFHGISPIQHRAIAVEALYGCVPYLLLFAYATVRRFQLRNL
jgi:hypothetical protein